MPFQPVPNTAEVRCTFTNDLHDKEVENLVYFSRGGGWSAAQIKTLADEAVLRFTTSLLPNHVPDHVDLTEVRARDLSTEFGPSAVGAGTPVSGLNVNAYSSPNNAALVRFIAATGPPRLGGIFWGFVAEGEVDETGLLTVSFKDTLELRVASWLEGLEVALGITHVIVSRFERATPPDEGSVLRAQGVTAQVTDYQTRRRVASQRDRRPALPGN